MNGNVCCMLGWGVFRNVFQLARGDRWIQRRIQKSTRPRPDPFPFNHWCEDFSSRLSPFLFGNFSAEHMDMECMCIDRCTCTAFRECKQILCNIEKSHPKMVTDIEWLPRTHEVSKRGEISPCDTAYSSQFVTVAGGGSVLFWCVQMSPSCPCA